MREKEEDREFIVSWSTVVCAEDGDTPLSVARYIASTTLGSLEPDTLQVLTVIDPDGFRHVVDVSR